MRSSLVLIVGGAAVPATAQYYGYGPPGYGPPGYGPAPYSYNAPPPPGREYGRPYDDEDMRPRMPRPLSARAVVDRLEDMGYEDVGRPRFTGTLYIVEATGPGDVRQQLTVDAIRGIILNRVVIAAPPRGGDDDDDDARPRRYGARPLDTDDLRRGPTVVTPPPLQPRREVARPAPIETEPLPPPASSGGATLPVPADPRLDPSTPRRAAPRPQEGRAANREARTEPRREPPADAGARPFGINPSPPPASAKREKAGEPPKAAQPAVDAKKPVAEARPRTEKPVRVIGGVTPLNNGESRSQLDNLPKPPDPTAPTGE